MKHWKLKTHIVAEEFFQFSLTTYLLLLLAETLQEGFVSYFFNLNILLGVVLLSGIAMVITQTEKKESEKKPQKIKKREIFYILILSLIGGCLVYLKTQELEGLSLVVAAITTLIIFLLSLLLFLV